MAKVTIHNTPQVETPTQAVVKAANQIHTATDAQGRKIGVKKLNALDRMRMFEAIGAENSKNEMYLGYASLAYHVASIDGEPISRPANKLQFEALIQRLDDDGLNAVAEAVAKLIAPEQADEETLKNESGTPS